MESKAEATRLDFEDLQLQVADLSENVSTLEDRVADLELAISGDKTCTDEFDNNANQLIDSADPSCGQDSTPGIEY